MATGYSLMSTTDTPEQHITCKTCGRSDVPDWDGYGHCITCARDAVLGGTPEQRLETTLDELTQDFVDDFTHGYDTAKSTGHNIEYHTWDTIEQYKTAILAAVTAELRAIAPGRPEKYIRMNSDCLEGYQIAIDTMITNAKARGFNL
jgi:hypothetical protein